jgi:hypothetical protein
MVYQLRYIRYVIVKLKTAIYSKRIILRYYLEMK